MVIFGYTVENTGWTSELFHGKPCLDLAGFTGLVELTVFVATFLIFVGNVHAYQDSRSGIVRTGHWDVQEFNLTSTRNETGFLKLSNVEFYGYDYGFLSNYTFGMCENLCLQICDCKGFQLKFIKHKYRSNIPYCYPKTQLLNGQHSPNFQGDMYLKVPKTLPIQEIGLDCSSTVVKQLNRTYTKHQENASLKFVVRFAMVVGSVELGIIFLVWCVFIRTHRNSSAGTQNYHRITTGFRKFTLSELKKATQGFSKEIGRGAGGVVYKGMLSDHRIAAVKRLNDAYKEKQSSRQKLAQLGNLIT
jgi:hypothetical protein